MLDIGVEEIRRLSQEEGMTDKEIAGILGVHRVTVNRIRNQNDIPKAKFINRQDKLVYCTICRKPFIIRRRERKYRCSECESKRN